MKNFLKNLLLVPFIIELFLINIIYAPYFIFKYFRFLKEPQIMELYNHNCLNLYKIINTLIIVFFVYSGLLIYMLFTSPMVLFRTIKTLTVK